MWPWEHVVVGYLAYSAVSHAVAGRAPSGRAAIAVAFAALLPDLVDKPLAWGLGVLPSGRSFAHSLVVAVPTVLGIGGVGGHARQVQRHRVDPGTMAVPIGEEHGSIGHDPVQGGTNRGLRSRRKPVKQGRMGSRD
jgi:hypothetical protein